MSVESIAAEVMTLSAEEVERLQLFINGEVAVRRQDLALRRRLGNAITEAQSLGYSDAQIEEVFAEAKVQPRGNRDKAWVPPRAEPSIIADLRNPKAPDVPTPPAPPAPEPPAPTPPTPPKRNM